ncbi:DUF6179 domain-containing protein [Candidatus Galacturonibacter soehngenii]|uniref:Uncharacterized protein n=1 Tax=Candidatus Galacturonatibacter soehngenii TaxID=2307010 RepID=A0A7V7QHW4_9FIRM|nr:DUF6179 domain-containing protein [Candidatus Galacturonibacter soehngenii]KAB1435701.1 hypothetical protein F7O84_15045 [Candidatus Galacturonibacter soehngenii]
MNEEELLKIVAKRIKKFTSNESTSVTYQTARQLMLSVIYCIKDEPVSLTKNTNMNQKYELIDLDQIKLEEAFYTGLKNKKEKIQKAKKLYGTILCAFDAYNVECYHETIMKGMKCFFERYDVEFDATNHILTLDYPLLFAATNLEGIDLIYEYLLRTYLEQKFLSGFDRNEILALLRAYHNGYKDLIINVAGIVLTNSLACVMVNHIFSTLSISNEERSKVKIICESKTVQEIEELLSTSLSILMEQNYKEDGSLRDYLSTKIHDIAYEIKFAISNNCLEKLLFYIKQEEAIQETVYIDGMQMEDEKLRELIKLMNSLSIKERICMIEKKVRSLADLKELLTECFYEGEYEYVFQLLGIEEKNILLAEIKEKQEFEELNEWEKKLLQF